MLILSNVFLARDATDIPGVKLAGCVAGILLLAVAVRAMFGKGKR